MNKPRKQHLVPQVYLKNFLNDSGNKHNSKFLKLMKNKDNKIISTNIRDSAVYRDFYTFKENYDWEHFYAKEVEPRYSLIASINLNSNCILFENGTRIISDDQKAIISKIIAYQWTRSSHTRNYLRNIYEEHGDAIRNNLINILPKKLITDEVIEKIRNIIESDDEYKDMSYQILTDEERIKSYSKYIFLKKWIFIKSETKDLFIISDNPIVIFNVNETTVKPFVDGLINDKTGILFPISSTLILVILPDILNTNRIFDKTIYRVSTKQSHDITNVANHLQYIWAENDLYSSSKEVLKKCIVSPKGHYVNTLIDSILHILK